MTGRAGGRAATGRWAVAAVLVLLASAVVLAALTGPVATGPVAPEQLPIAGQPTAAVDYPEITPPTPGPRRPVSGPPWPAWQWIFVGGLVVLGVLVGALLLSLRRLLPQPDPVDDPERPARRERPTAPPPDRLVAAADEGLALLAGPGDVTDAVIACWVRLEEAAAATGLPRHPASTPSEFTAALLVAGVGREAEVHELLGLYHRARFGSRRLPDDAAERAVACLTAIRASAQAAAPGRTP